MSIHIKTVVIFIMFGVVTASGNVVPLQDADTIIIPDTIAEASDISTAWPSFNPTLESPQGLNLTSAAPVTSAVSASTLSPAEPIWIQQPVGTTAQSSAAVSKAPALTPAPASTVAPPLVAPSVPLTPEGAVPSTPEGAVPLTPEGAVPLTPEGAVPLTPEGAVLLTPEGAETVQVIQSSVPPPVRETDKPIMDIIQKGLTRLRHAMDRLKRFIEKIEDGIKNGAVSQTIENVKAKIESGKVDLNELISAYKQQSPMNFEDLIRRISDDTHILLDKLHGRVDSFGGYNKDIPHDASDESAEDHHPRHPTAQPSAPNPSVQTPNSVP